jgi:ubiquinone/menaquinone biosynthesis C-methylase UbiE
MLGEHFDEEYALKGPENYERFFVPTIGGPLAEDLIRVAALQPGERVLDVGCGTGVVARMASKKVGSDGTVVGLDINPGMLAIAASIVPPDRSIEWHEANAESMPLPDQSFDVVLCQLSLQFMEDKPAALEEMHRVLVEGGRVVLNVPGPATPLFTTLADAMGRHISAEAAGFVTHAFSPHERTAIELLINRAGFRDVDVQEKDKTLSLPAPKDFLWQYVRSTPLAAAVTQANDAAILALESEVVDRWQDFEEDGVLTYKQRIVTAVARK